LTTSGDLAGVGGASDDGVARVKRCRRRWPTPARLCAVAADAPPTAAPRSEACPTPSQGIALRALWEQELLPDFERQEAALLARLNPPAVVADADAAAALVAAAERAFLALRRAAALARHLARGGGSGDDDDDDDDGRRAAASVLAAASARTAGLLSSDALLAGAEAAMRALLPPPPPRPPPPPPGAAAAQTAGAAAPPVATSTKTPPKFSPPLANLAHRRHRAAQLVRRLRREGWQPRRASRAAAALSAEAQREMQGALAAQARGCCARAGLELTSDACAPRVEADAEGAAEVLGPLGLFGLVTPEEGAAAGGSAEGGGGDTGGATTARPPLFCAERSELVLTLPAVEAVLERHPRPDVREAVAAAGMGPRTDALLRAWREAGDARRRLARARGEPSHAAALARETDGLLPVGAGPGASAAPWGFEVVVGAPPRASRSSAPGASSSGSQTSPAAAFLGALDRGLRQLEPEGGRQAPPAPLPPLSLDALFGGAGSSPLLDRALCGVGEVVRAAFGLELRHGGGGGEEARGQGGGTAGGGGLPAEAARRQRGAAPRPLRVLHVHDARTAALLGTVFVDPAGGYGTRQLLFGPRSPGGGGDERQEDALPPPSPSPPPSLLSSESAPAASVGLQAGAVLLAASADALLAAVPPGADPAQAVADALAELAHELGHALHFVLSSSSASASASASRAPPQQQPRQRQAPSGDDDDDDATATGPLDPPSYPVASASAEQPLWLLELPSTLLELLCSDARAIARMLLPPPLPPDAAGAASAAAAAADHVSDTVAAAARTLAARQARRRTPGALRGLAAIMRADEAVSWWSGPRQPELADAARAWERAAMGGAAAADAEDGDDRGQGAPPLPPLLLTPEQARAAPRVLSAQAQAYGYLVAWCLASAIAGEMMTSGGGGGGGGRVGGEERPGAGASAAAAATTAAAATAAAAGAAAAAEFSEALGWICPAAGRAVRTHLLEAGSALPAAGTARELVRAVLRETRPPGEAGGGGGGAGVALGLRDGDGAGGTCGSVRATFVASPPAYEAR